MDDLTARARALRAVPPSCGPVRLIAVDGHAGSGKSTFADRLAAALDGAPVLRLDDLASHRHLFEWTERLTEQVVEPLSRGAYAHYRAYDWTARRFDAPRALPPAPVVVMEGVGAGRRELRPYLARLFWMDRGAEESWERGQPARRPRPVRFLGRLDGGGDTPLRVGPLPPVRRRAGAGEAGGVRDGPRARNGPGTGPDPH